VTGALATARRLALGAWLAGMGLALVPRSELEDLRRIADQARQARRGGAWGRDLWVDRLENGPPRQYQSAEPGDACGICGVPARLWTCSICTVADYVIPCEHMLPAPFAWGLADGSHADEMFCAACVKETT